MRGYPRNWLTDRPADEVVVTRTTQSRGYGISFDDAGSGPAIVLIPGSTMSAGDWRDAGYVDLLARTHRVISMDPLGLGLSDKPHDPEAYRYPDVADDVIAVMDSAGIGRAVLWGYSRGGALAGVVAAGHPDRVAAVILHSGAPEEVLKGSAPSEYAEAMMRGDFALLWNGGRFTFTDDDRRYDVEFNDPVAIGAMAIGPRRSGLSTDLGRIVAPTLVIEGSEDEAEAKPVAAALGVELHVLPECDHLDAFSRLDLVMPIVNGFLEPLGL
jgi:pimeloyl-ACP methyl ester carboxylesterase